MALFDRTYRLLVGKAGGKGVEIGPPLNIEFEVDKTPKEEPNHSTIKVWNLAKTTRDAICEPDLFCVLYAGYAEQDGPVLLASGHILDAWTYFDGPDVITQLEILDGGVEYRDTVVSVGYGAGASAKQIIRDIAKQMGLVLYMADNAPDRTWQHGFSYFGAARTALHKVVHGAGLEWSIQNQTLQVLKKGEVSARAGIVLSSESGLIGYPERTREGAKEKTDVKTVKGGKKTIEDRQRRTGWRVTSLLMPQVNPGDRVKLESKAVQGWFRADTVKHSGDFGGDWFTEMDLVDPNSPIKDKKT